MLPLGLIGAGNMAEAIVRAMIAREVARPNDLFAADPNKGRRELFTSMGVHATPDNREVARRARTLLLSCKPQQMREVLEEIREDLSPEALVVSIAAGISTDAITGFLARPQRVVRVMPNTPLMMGEGMAAIAPGTTATPDDLRKVLSIFEVAGRVVEVREELMDAVTAVSGSGPAYYFLLTEHLARAAEELGLDPETAQVLARQTALGSAIMLARSIEPPEELRRKVTSPNGTTQAAVEHMEKHNLPKIFREAVAAACRRSEALRKG